MRTLQRELSKFFAAKRPRQPDYDRKPRAAFKAEISGLGSSFVKSRDGYIEVAPCPALPKGLVTAFHDWDDAYSRLVAVMANPALAPDGDYVE